jgi:ribose 5-phosphate isomerase B
MRIAVGCDHAGFEAPEPFYMPGIVAHLEGRGLEVVDCGTDGPDAVDYPDFAKRVCEAMRDGRADRGVLLCGTGIGMSIMANRNPGIRAGVCLNPEMVRMARVHNDANIICLGRRLLSLNECTDLIDLWLSTEASDAERHKRRVGKMG